MVIENPDVINRITKELYPGVGKRFNTSGDPPCHRGRLEPGPYRHAEQGVRVPGGHQGGQAHQWGVYRNAQ